MKQYYLNLTGATVAIFIAVFCIYKGSKTNPILTTKTSTQEKLIDNTPAAGIVTSYDAVETKSIKSLSLDSSNTIVLVGEVGSQAMDVAQEITNRSESGQPVYLLINSPGGSVLDGVMIVSAMQASKAPVYTVCLQICASMAAIIHQYGTKRYMVDRSILMFHEAAGGLSGPFNQMRSRFHVFDRLVNKMDFEVANKVGLPPDQFRSMLANEVWLDAEDAVKQKFADKLVNLHLNISSYSSTEQARLLRSQTQTLQKDVKIDLKWIR